ncbi:MAG: FliA/WhiG family RNA polymerase sigma factor [Nitrospina sp.]|nr:FliA/WhiG family RNA polymerase sigma factor [Nitrospina sp.]MBT4260492.1 FliA/WhiG family RNA polymerase sigma factor [Nitrospina sp.]MBT5257332.1 FliA/WhiG family RNA polymerase sigma factor [Nitrospina sp.]MBT6662609.1 FliA/WhiG family RNA polymerase sigma factor [Nitrospina sp.]MBT7271964.1 FliA/WhiG family RNA polymerase sigma factor [Nitrospina sp.]
MASKQVVEEIEITPENREEVIKRYSPMIKYVANRIAMRLPPHIEVDDLISVGVLGLMDAISKYDSTRGAKFKTYAEFRVRGAILDELRSLDWVPRSIRQKASQVDKVVQELQAKLSRSPEDEEVAKEMGLNLDQFHDTLNETKSMPVFSLEDLGLAKDSGEQQSLLDCLAGKADADPQTQIRLVELKEIIAKAIDGLPEKERLMVSLYYYEELTMKEIGAVLEITESRVSQIHSKAVYRLRTKLKAIIAEEL